jgi:type II secretory pathway pseudopilin PulG
MQRERYGVRPPVKLHRRSYAAPLAIVLMLLRNQSVRKGMTLLETLVFFAMMATLVGLLFPCIPKTDEKDG